MARLPAGTLSESYQVDKAIVRTRLQWGLSIAGLILLFILPLFVNSDRTLILLNTIGITIITVQGLNILTGYCGQINLGQVGFMAVGGYTSAILAININLPFWICLPLAGIATAMVGVIFGLPALRVKGFYLALATIAAQFIILFCVYLIPDLTGGAAGLTIPSPNLGGIVFNSEQNFYYIIIVAVIITTFFAKNLARTRVGRAFIAIRDNDLAAEVMGISLAKYKTMAFAICAFYAGIAGSLWAYYTGVVHPDQYTMVDSIWYVGMVIVGGMGSTVGAIFGTIFLRLIEEMANSQLAPWLGTVFPAIAGQASASMALFFQGLIIALFLIFEPRGIAHRWETFKASYRLWPFPY